MAKGKMKKYFLLFGIGFLLFSLQGCNKSTTVNQIKPNVQMKEVSYKIEKNILREGKIDFRYPQLSQSGKNWDKVNQIIESEIKEDEIQDVLSQSQITQDQLTLDYDYRITYQSKDILSILYTGSNYIQGGMHPDSDAYGLTLDLKKQRILYLGDFADINEDFANQIAESKNWYNQVTKDSADESTQTQAEVNLALQQEMSGYARKDMIYDLICKSSKDFYLTHDGIGIILMASHAIGDYGRTELKGSYPLKESNGYNPYLAKRNENVVLSFKTKSNKTASICEQKEGKYLVYRYGTKDKIELEYPTLTDNSWSKFVYASHFKDKKSKNDIQVLRFENKGYRYEIYYYYDTGLGEEKQGVLVTNLSTDKSTDLKGNNTNAIGNLYIVSPSGESDKLKIEE